MNNGQKTEHDIDRIAYHFEQLVEELRTAQMRNERPGFGRLYAITIAETEKARAYFDCYVVRAEPCLDSPDGRGEGIEQRAG